MEDILKRISVGVCVRNFDEILAQDVDELDKTEYKVKADFKKKIIFIEE